MSTLSFKPLLPLFNVAVLACCNRVWPQGFDTSPDAPDSLRRLKAEMAARGRITVYSESSDSTVFDCREVNQAFRAWHDWCHLVLDAPFNLEGETRACREQERHIFARYGDGDTGQELAALLRAEVIGQAKYYQLHKRYIQNQRAFAVDYMAHGDSILNNVY